MACRPPPCRYVFDPADVAAEMEVTSRVRKAAAEALMQAEEKLRVAEQAQAAMQKQLEQAKELSKVSFGGGGEAGERREASRGAGGRRPHP